MITPAEVIEGVALDYAETAKRMVGHATCGPLLIISDDLMDLIAQERAR